MVELKLSQGAKPGHGGVLPAPKVSARDRADARRADGRGLHLAGAAISAFSTPIEMMQFIAELRDAVGRQAGRLQALRRPSAGSSWRSARRCSRPASRPTSSSSTATKAAPAPRRSNSSTTSACRCARACCFVHNALVGIGAARAASSSARRQDRHRLRHRARAWRSAPTGATRRAASCSRSAASSRRAATPTAARPASPPRTRPPAARWSCRQAPARRQLPQGDPSRAGRADRGRRPRPSQRVQARSTSPAALAQPGRDLRRPLSVAAEGELVPAPTIRAGGSPGTWRTPIRSGRWPRNSFSSSLIESEALSARVIAGGEGL